MCARTAGGRQAARAASVAADCGLVMMPARQPQGCSRARVRELCASGARRWSVEDHSSPLPPSAPSRGLAVELSGEAGQGGSASRRLACVHTHAHAELCPQQWAHMSAALSPWWPHSYGSPDGEPYMSEPKAHGYAR